MKNVEQDLEAKDWTAKEHLERKPSSEKFNKAKIKARGLQRDLLLPLMRTSVLGLKNIVNLSL